LDEVLEHHRSWRTLDLERKGAVLVDRHDDADDLALDVLRGGVELLNELTGVYAILTKCRPNGRRRCGNTAGGLNLEDVTDLFLGHSPSSKRRSILTGSERVSKRRGRGVLRTQD